MYRADAPSLYKPVSSVIHRISLEDMQLDVAGLGTRRLYHA